MNPLQQLSDYLRRVERNLRLLTFARGSAILFGAALGVTVALVFVMNRLSFSDPSVFYSRLFLFFILAAALCVTLITPLLRLNQKRVARLAESRHPELGQRLLTFVERRNSNDAFLPLLAADALPYAATASPDAIAAPSRAMAFGTVAVLAAALLVWLGMNGPGYFGYGASLLWGISKEESKPFYFISIQPGNHRVRRHADQLIDARLNGFFSRQASLFVRYSSATRWEETPMRPQPDGSAFQFLLVGVPEDVEYYVVSNGIHSTTAKLTAVDLPAITHLRVTYHFPTVYGLKDTTEDPGGDLRALQGTVAEIAIETDKPLSKGSVIIDDGKGNGKQIELSGEGSKHTASVPIEKDGTYHFATPDGGETVRLSDDYFIEARPDSPPTITVRRPARDARVTPIEEVPVELEARDDNGIQSMDLHYSVNGGPEQVRPMLSAKGAKEASGTSLLSLEDYKLVPGDIVSLYATARDAKTTAKSDIFFVEGRPFELNYHQGQSSGGSGAGMDEPKMAEREKEIIAATFNQLRSDKHDAAAEAENAKYLAGVQSKLRDEAQSLESRIKARSLEGSGAEFQQFLTTMQSAVESMAPAADQLRGKKWNDALSPEQKALQYLLRAEAISRDIQVVMSQSSGAGGGGKSGASRDLEGLTSLELDTQKNQYESGNQSAADQAQKEADEALKKLEELAKRQQELAQQQQQNQQNFQQRWQQEMLRREAEQLRQKLQELARNQQQGQQQSSQGSSSSQGSQQSSSQQSGSQQSSSQQSGSQQSSSQQSGSSQSGSPQKGSPQSGSQQTGSQQARSGQDQQSSPRTGGRMQPGTQQALENALQSLTEAERKMGEAASHGAPSQAADAAQQLNRAESAMAGMRHDQNGSEISNLDAQARRLATQQERFDEKLRRSFADGAAGNRTDRQNEQLNSQLADEKKREIDDLHQLEHSLQQTARGMQNTQPETARKLRDAIGQMQQDELESRMKWTVDALNRKMGSYAIMRESPVTRGLNELKDRVGDAASSMTAAGAKPADSNQALEQALARAEKLRKDLQAMAGREPGQEAGEKPSSQGSPNSSGKPSDGKTGKTPGNQPSNQSGNQPGNQPGSQSGSQSSGQPGNNASSQGSAGSSPSGGPAQGEQGDSPGFGARGARTHGGSPNTGSSAPGGSWDASSFAPSSYPARPADPARAQREYDEAVREIGRLQSSLQSDPATAKQLQDLQRDLQRMNPRGVYGDPAKLTALEGKIVATAEEAELILRRKLDQDGSIRTTAPQNIPPGYATAVAEYFRHLSSR